jgi:cell pole-organizing protein PopZ
MADIKTEQEPSIEEILESIRQIISEDGTPVTPEAQPQPPAVAKPVPKPQAEQAPPPKPVAKAPPPQQQAAVPKPPVQPPKAAVAPPPPLPSPPPAAQAPVLELTDKVEEEPPAKPRIIMQEIEMENTPLMSELTEEAAVAAMARILAQNLAVERELPGKPGHLTLEDIARDIMHPLIKVWLDKNLPVIIEKLVAREIEKLSHRAMDKQQ